MAKSREEVLASLKGIFNGNGGSQPAKSEPKTQQAVKPAAPAKSSVFGKFKRVEEEAVEAEEVEETVEDEEETEEEVVEAEETTGVLPELLSRVEALIDFVVENEDALKEMMTAARS